MLVGGATAFAQLHSQGLQFCVLTGLRTFKGQEQLLLYFIPCGWIEFCNAYSTGPPLPPVIAPILQMRKLRRLEMQELPQGHIVCEE